MGAMDEREFLGARDQVDIDVEERVWVRAEREYDDASEPVGEEARGCCAVCALDRMGVADVCLTGVETELERLDVRCRDANVEL